MGGKSKSVTVGYWYYTDVLATLCHSGPDDDIELVEVQVGERTAWSGSVVESGTISVVARDLFGGEKREGGVEGNIDVMMGKPSMSVNSFLGASMRASGITGPVPAYRRVLSLFFRGGATDSEFTPSPEFEIITADSPKPPPSGSPPAPYIPPAFRWAALNPYFKKFRVKLRRYWAGWYSARAKIGNDANPAHIVFECFTNAEWGMGYPAGDLDPIRFQAVADYLYNEGFGLSLTWSQQTSIEEFIKMIMQHINGVVCQDRVTGQLFPKLVRNDYDPADLIELNPTNCILESYSRPGFGETVNEVVLKYTTRNGETDAVTVQDLAGITSQGQVVSQTVEMPGIRDPELAARVAQRELESRTKPISKLTLIAGRVAYPLYEGDVFKFSWPAHGITEVYYRVVSISLGRLEDNSMQIEAVEDVFGLPNASYAKPQPIGWVDTNQTPVPVVAQALREASYYEVINLTSEPDRASFPDEFGFALSFGAKPQSDTSRYSLNYSPDNSSYEEAASGNWTPTATLVDAIEPLDTVLTVENGSGLNFVTAGMIGYIGDELVQVSEVSLPSSITVERGVIDSVPVAHEAGTRVWFHSDLYFGVDEDVKVAGETAYYKLATVSSLGQLPLSLATPISMTFNQRFDRPYPPGNVKLNGDYFPDRIVSKLLLTWAHRDRTAQTVDPVPWTTGSIGPEPGVTYTVELRNSSNTLVHSSTGIASADWDSQLNDVVLPNPVKARVYSVRDGLASKDYFEHTVALAGYGRAYGFSYGGVNTPGVVVPRSTPVVDYDAIVRTPNPVLIPVAFDGTRLVFQVYYTRKSTGVNYYGLAWMLPGDSSLTLERGSQMPGGSSGSFAVLGSYLVRHLGQGGWSYRTELSTAYQADLADWSTSTIASGLTSVPVESDGTRVFTFDTDSGGESDSFGQLATSTDGLSYTITAPLAGSGMNPIEAAYLNGSYYVAGHIRAGKPYFATSPDLESFTTRNMGLTIPSLPVNTYLGAVRNLNFFNGNIVAVAGLNQGPDAGAHFMTSNDGGVSWSRRSPPDIGGLGVTVVFGGALLVFGVGKVARTTDLSTWTTHDLPNASMRVSNPVQGGGTLVLQVIQGNPIKTTNGTTYTTVNY